MVIIDRSLTICFISFRGLGNVCLLITITIPYSILSIIRLDNCDPSPSLGRFTSMGEVVHIIMCLASGNAFPGEKYPIVVVTSLFEEGQL